MDILISNSSDKPIYEQICLQIKGLIMDGTLQPGEMLPSMRGLAKDLHISVITVSTQNKDFIQEEQLRIAEELLQKAAMIGRSYNISYEQMSKILLLFYEE